MCQITVDRVVGISKSLNKRFGTVLEEMGLITAGELAEALARQYSCRTVSNFARAAFPPQLLGVLTAETALQNLIFPLKLEQGKLHLAMFDPTPTRLLANIAANNQVTVIPYVASRKEINQAICRHYFGLDVGEPARRSVLVAEDDKFVLSMLGNLLSKQYEVFSATNGMDAYKEAIGRKPQVILTDMEMPKLDGFGLLTALQSIPETKGIPVILISGTTSAEAESKAFERGFFDFIPKPVKETTILTRVKRAFDFYDQHNYLFLR
ncbi:response regulator [Geomonas sp. Red32]|uniref:response regulator n=1 Tax=Geomonas sp. Red32 TaxID=2912856 RepID=UPI00202CEBC5|nr:response regulator [Geomonas sp. Red32]MCM0081968.1 response regulator [Geomonas sp. Red32]